MTKRQIFSGLLAIFSMGILGCGEYLAPNSGGEIRDGQAPQVQHIYADHVDGVHADHLAMQTITLGDSQEAHRTFSVPGEARFHYPDPFLQVGIMIDAEDVEELAYRQLGQDETWSEWKAVDVYFSEGIIHNGLILTGEPATAVELRGAQGVSFAHLEFHSQVIARDVLIRSSPEVPSLTNAAEPGEMEPASDIESRRQAVAPSNLVTSRHQWNAVDPDKICNSVVAPYRMTVHHTASASGPEDDNHARMRGIQSFHLNGRGWCDIGYHFVVAYDGEIMQGRSRSDRPGAHVGAHNPGNVGISMIGMYTTTAPPDAQIEGVATMVRWVHETHGVPINRDIVRGHREWPDTATACPGDSGLARLDEILAIAGAEEVEPDQYNVQISVAIDGLDDFYQQGTSISVPDAFAGETFTAEIYVTNNSDGPIRGVELGYAFDVPGLVATNYRIETDAPILDGSSWQINDADSAPGNPDRHELGAQGGLTMYAFAAGETKRVVVELEAEEYNIGFGEFSGLRAWVLNINDLYTQQTYDSAPTLNLFDAPLREEARVDVLSRGEWQFRAGEPADLEGWTGFNESAFVELVLNTSQDHLALRVSDVRAGVDSPDWTRIDADAYGELVLRVRSHDGEHGKAVYWAGPGEEFSEDRSVGFRADGDGEYQTLVIALETHPLWSGEISRLRLVLNDDLALQAEHSGWYDIDYVYFQNRSVQETTSATLGIVDQAGVDIYWDRGDSTFREPRLVDAAQGDMPRVKSNMGCVVARSAAGSELPGAGWLLVLLALMGRFRPWRKFRHGPGSQSGYEDRRSAG